ncbi:MAG: hypothetical protein ABEK16_00375 [Candidatus Nanohalobium sp.]
MSTTRDTSESVDESLENPVSDLTVEEANRLLDDTVYEVEKVQESYRLSTDSGEHVGTYQDILGLAEDLEDMEQGLDGMYGFFENDGRATIYGRWSGDNLVQSTEYVDLQEMR